MCQYSLSAAETIAGPLDADADEVIFTSGATESYNHALFGVALNALKGRNRILVSAIEHKYVLDVARAFKLRHGIEIQYLPVLPTGLIDLDALEAVLNDKVIMVSVMAVNNEIGAIQSLEEIAKIVSSRGIPFHCDAARAPCAIDMRILADFADLVSLSSHKIYGPRGSGPYTFAENFTDVWSLSCMVENSKTGYAPEPRYCHRAWAWQKQRNC